MVGRIFSRFELCCEVFDNITTIVYGVVLIALDGTRRLADIYGSTKED